MRNDDAGKVVLVTKAASGIAALSVRVRAPAGHTVYAGIRRTTTRDVTAVAGLAHYGTDHQVEAHTVELDVTCQDSADAAVDRIVAERDRLDVVEHNAGHVVLGAAEAAFTAEQFADLYDVNVPSWVPRAPSALPCRSRRVSRARGCWCGSAAPAPAAAAPVPGPVLRRQGRDGRPGRQLRRRGAPVRHRPRSWCSVRSPPTPTTSPTQTPRRHRPCGSPRPASPTSEGRSGQVPGRAHPFGRRCDRGR